MSKLLIRVDKARVAHYGAHALFDALNFTLHEGEHTAILGANGAGKSSFLCLLRGEIFPQSGHVFWYLGDTVESSPIIGRTMTSLISTAQQELYVRNAWQLDALDIVLTAFYDSTLLYNFPDDTQRAEAEHMAARLGCAQLLHMKAPALSQGQMRLVLLARALLRSCPVLLLDEYSDGLDAKTRRRVFDVLEEEAAHCTMVVTAHRDKDLPAWIQRHIHIAGGTLMSAMPREAIAKSTNVNTVHCMHEPPEKHAPSAAPLLLVEHATVFVEREALLHDICWSLHRGEHWYIGGGNGAGKSIFLRLLAGDLHAAYGGRVERYLDTIKTEDTTQKLAPVTELAQLRRAIRLVSDKEQACYAHSRERLHDVTGIELVLSGYEGTVGLYREYSQEEVAHAHAHLYALSLTVLAQRRIRTLSSGQLRRLFLARALLTRPQEGKCPPEDNVQSLPQILLLDEPFSGLDAASRTHMRDILESISAHVHLVLVSHHDEDCLPCISRRAHMERGRLHTM